MWRRRRRRTMRCRKGELQGLNCEYRKGELRRRKRLQTHGESEHVEKAMRG